MDDKNLSPKKRYTQHYRKKWEDIPQLRGWLSMFPHKNPEKTKAFCKYCQRKLVPHVTGLLKHAACRAHLKASRSYMDRIRDGIRRAEEKAKQQSVLKKEMVSATPPRVIVPSTSTDPEVTEGEDGVPKITVLVQDVPDDPEEDNLDMDRDMDDDDDENHMSDNEEHSTLIQDPLSQQVKIRVVMDDALLSTNIVDTTKGVPVVGLGVSLYQLKEGRWTILSDSVTDAEGRCSDLLKDNSITLHAGRFKMHYDVSQYYAIRNQECFFPFIEVVFDISNPQEKYHIPLLLSPYSYSTYKGS